MFSFESLRMHRWRVPFATPELSELEHMTKVAIARHQQYLYLREFGVLPEYQGQGYGKALLLHVQSIADERGLAMCLETFTQSNRLLYEHFGYHVVGQVNVPGCVDPWFAMVRDPLPCAKKE